MDGFSPTHSEPTLYIVEADAVLCDELLRSFQTIGIHAQAFRTAGEFLNAFDENRLACLLLGIQLPGPTDLDVLQDLRERGSSVPVIVMTSCHEFAVPVRAMKMGAFDVIEKPPGRQVLFDTVWSALRLHAELRRRSSLQDGLRTRLDLLSAREREVLPHIVEGNSSRQIAEELRVSPKTIEHHRAAIMRKMGVHGVVDLVRIICQSASGSSAPVAAGR